MFHLGFKKTIDESDEVLWIVGWKTRAAEQHADRMSKKLSLKESIRFQIGVAAISC